MIEILIHIFQGMSLFIIFMLMISSFSLLFKNNRDSVFGYRVNIFLTLMLNITIAAPVLLQNRTLYYLAFFTGQLLFLLIYPFVFRMIYKKSNRLLINLVMIMLSVGMPVLTRLNRQKAVKQFVFILGACIIAMVIPVFLKKFEATKKIATAFGILGLGLLGVVLILSKTTYGANLSLSIGPISIQPSEFVKITFVLLIAKMFRERQDFKRVMFVTAVALLHAGVLVLSKDLGGALIYYGIFTMMLYVATKKKRYPALALVLLAVGGTAAFFLFSHVRVRVTAWLDPWSVIQNQGYQVAQSLFSIADGNWLGKGMTLGSPGSIPVVEKDFIFAAICEELGGIFGICLIMICLCLLLSMIKVAIKNSVMFYKLIGIGLATSYGIQAFLTIGGAIKLIPSTGVTLPFVSYGGSSVMASMMVFAILQGLYIKGMDIEAAKQLDRELKEAVEEIHEISKDGKKIIRKRVKVPNKKQQELLEHDDTKTATVSRNNFESRTIGYLFLLMYGALILALMIFIAFESTSDNIVNNSYYVHKSESNAAARVIRGSIVSSDGVVLAYTDTSDGKEERKYPFDNLFSHVVGYNTSGSVIGMEANANSYLINATRNIKESIQADVTGSKQLGDTVISSIDSRLQYVAYAAMGDYEGAVVVMEADTGRILAMVSKPDYNPNEIDEIMNNLSADSGDSFLFNRALSGQYPPGSTFKLLTSLAYIREHPEDYMNYSYECTGSYSFGNIVINCSEGHVHGTRNLITGLEESCNGVFADIGTTLGNNTLMKIGEEFRFNTGITSGISFAKSKLPVDATTSAGEKTQICIGQGAVVETPLHNALITAAIANGGKLVAPRYIDAIVSATTGKYVKSFNTEVIDTVLTEKECEILENAMLSVVNNGTGFNAKSEYYYSAGKTGSAQYSSSIDKLHAWYTGYAWTDEGKKIVVSVVLEGAGSGGWNAAPVAKTIFDRYFGIKE